MPIELICSGHSTHTFQQRFIEAIENIENFVEGGWAGALQKNVRVADLAFPPCKRSLQRGIIADSVSQPEYSYAHAQTKALRERFGGGVGYPSISARIPA